MDQCHRKMKTLPESQDTLQAKTGRDKNVIISADIFCICKEKWLATLEPAHLRNKSDRLMIQAHLFSCDGLEQSREIAILSCVTSVGDVLPNVLVLQAEDAHCDLIHRIFKLQREKEQPSQATALVYCHKEREKMETLRA